MPKGSGKQLAQNKKAYHDFFINKHLSRIVLKGTEIKAIRAARVNLKDAFAKIKSELSS
jgi:SsrA-binding protein